MNEGGKKFVRDALRRRLEKNGLDPETVEEIMDRLDLNACQNLRDAISYSTSQTV